MDQERHFGATIVPVGKVTKMPRFMGCLATFDEAARIRRHNFAQACEL
jgi:hypothetical protein